MHNRAMVDAFRPRDARDGSSASSLCPGYRRMRQLVNLTGICHNQLSLTPVISDKRMEQALANPPGTTWKQVACEGRR